MRSMTLRSIILPVVFVLIFSTTGCGTTSASHTGSGKAGPAIESMSGDMDINAVMDIVTDSDGFLYDHHRR